MKIIDLLNKIANGEEVPKKIKIGNSPFELTLSTDGKHYSGNTDSVLNNVLGMNKLNNEVEIIEEEKKIPEKIEEIVNGDFLELPSTHDIMNKINEIIDYLDYLKSKGE